MTIDNTDQQGLRRAMLTAFLRPGVQLMDEQGLPAWPFARNTPGLRANAHYFSHPRWMADWIEQVHRYPELRERWIAAAGDWTGKIVVDIGCGPGNLFASLGGTPTMLIGVDVAAGSLRIAESRGYCPLLADAHDVPLDSGIADLVAINGSLHHCDDMDVVLREAARIVKPGGLLVVDHDPQRSAYDLRGVGRLLWKLRLPIYRWMKKGGHSPIDDEQTWALATEIHHQLGDGVTAELFCDTLQPLGFDVRLVPHNHQVGAEVLNGAMGRAPLPIRIAQRLSGRSPQSVDAALTIMCVARKSGL